MGVAVLLARVLHEHGELRAPVLLGERERVDSAAASGMPSNTSVFTSRSSGTISRYSPWKATSNPSFASIT